MFQPAHEERATKRRFGLAEALLVVGILVFGGFTLVADGRQSFESIVAGLNDALHR